MPTREEFIEEIDRVLAAQKTMVGADGAQWVDGRTVGDKRLKLPLAIDGVQYGSELVVVAYPHEPSRFSILIVHRIAVCRLDMTDQGEIHGNFQALTTENIPPLVYGPHFHAWELNRRLIEGSNKLQKLPLAKPFTSTVNFEPALRWFCAETRIEIPYDFDFALPQPDQLF